MPNLKRWIEAQLKRGYTREQIKSALTKKGYPLKVVAEVDKAGIDTGMSKIKTSNSKQNTHSIALLIAIAIIIAVIALYVFSNKENKEETKTDQIAARPSNVSNRSNIINQSIILNQSIQTFSGKLIEINSNSFTLDKNGESFTIMHNGPLENIAISKVLQNRTIVNSSLAELKQAYEVVLAVATEDGKNVVRAVLITNMTKNPAS